MRAFFICQEMRWEDVKAGYNEVRQLAKSYNTIPLCKEIYADVITPIGLLLKIARISSRFYLFESIEGGEKWARYSFLGFDPIMRIVGKNKKIVCDGKRCEKGSTVPGSGGRNQAILTKYKAPKLAGMPPFAGGLVGYFAYSMIGYTEPAFKSEKQ